MYIVDNTTSLISATVVNVALNSEGGVPVICAWPLSGQYGPGARMLYYVLIIICIFAAHLEWMRGACLAAALLFPAVAAIHALTISSLSETAGPVDLDVFGTFQLCAIGVLTVPITIRYSRTYFETKGRNVVFMWTALNLAGLLSLIVAFYRADPKSCRDGSGQIVSWSTFQSTPDICGPCDTEHTLIRKDPSNPAQWILAPHVGMTINTATLLSAACCIPSILSLLSVWTKVMHLNWLRRWRKNDRSGSGLEGGGGGGDNASVQPAQDGRPEDDEDAARAERFMEKRIKLVLGLVERIVFTACILAIVVLGERNFWSHEMREGVEPITSIGQWGPIVGAALAVVGSVWTSSGDDSQDDDFLPESPEQVPEGTALTGEAGAGAGPSRQATGGAESTVPGQGHRGRVNKGLFKVLKIWGTPGAERFADDVRTRKYRDYPLIPGEKERNEHLERDRQHHQERQQTIASQMMQRRGSNASIRPSMDDARSVRTRANSSDSLAPPGSGAITPPAPVRPRAGQHLTVPERRYTNPQEASPVPHTSPDSPQAVRPFIPGVPMIMVEEAVDSDSDTSSARDSPERSRHRTFRL